MSKEVRDELSLKADDNEERPASPILFVVEKRINIKTMKQD